MLSSLPGPLLALLALLVLATAGPPPGDVEQPLDWIELKDGRRVEGRVVFEDESELILLVGSRERSYPKDDLREVRALRRELPGALDLIDELGRGDRDGHLALAERLEERGLPFEAAILNWRAVLLDPSCEAGHEALGHRKSGSAWRVPHGARLWTMDKRRELARDWGEAWEVPTSHFRLRTNVELERALDVALILERVYLTFHQTYAEAFELHEAVEPMEAWIHADSASFPESGGGRKGYFSPADNRLYLDASAGLPWRTLAHEVTHQLLWAAAAGRRGQRGDLPGWLDEGLAQALELAMGYENEGWISPGRLELLALHARADDPYGLKRVLNFRSDDFLGTDANLKYAQAFSLVDFLWRGPSELRDGFERYVHGALAGQSSSTHFKKAMGLSERELEEAWVEWVERTAGG